MRRRRSTCLPETQSVLGPNWEAVYWRRQSRGGRRALLSWDSRYLGQRHQQRKPEHCAGELYYGLRQLLRSRRLLDRTKYEIYWYIVLKWLIDLPSMDTSLGPSERRMQTLWACLGDASFEPSLAVHKVDYLHVFKVSRAQYITYRIVWLSTDNLDRVHKWGSREVKISCE